MSSDATGFIGNIPQYYDQGLGPIIFAEYAADIARRTAASRRRFRAPAPDGWRRCALRYLPHIQRR